MNLGNVVVVGSLNYDTTLRVHHIPLSGETVIAQSIQRFHGGKGANQALAAARAGTQVTMIGCVGNDAFGERICHSLAENGVDTSFIERRPDVDTGQAYICVSDQGENCITVCPGANALVDIEMVKRYEQVILNASLCVLQMEIPIETIEYMIQICRQNAIRVILNPAPAHPLNDSVLQGLYMLIPNQSELEMLTGTVHHSVEEKAQALYQKGIGNILITLGAEGALLLNTDGVQRYSAFAVRAVDTTGAGDAFIGALAAEISAGRDIDWAIRFAGAAAAIAIQRPGAQDSFACREEIIAFLESKK